jgi:carbonic anhydrase
VEAVGSDGSVDEIAKKNVELTIEEILYNSPILKDMVDSGEIGISGGMYDVSSGEVTFL